MPSILWYTQDIPSILHELNSSLDQGLSSKEAVSRLQRYGKNRIPDPNDPKAKSTYQIFLRQTFSPLYLVLVAFAFALTYLEAPNGTLIAASALVFILFDLTIKTTQATKLAQILTLLKKPTPYKAKLLRNGQIIEIFYEDVVPGDIIIFKVGDHIPADSRLIEAKSLSLDESPITGRSQPVHKNEGVIAEIVGLSDRKNMVYMGTFVVSGSGKAIVVTTGAHSEIYNSIRLLGYQKDLNTDMDWKLKLKKLTNLTAWIGVFLAILLGSLEWLKEGNLIDGIAIATMVSTSSFIPMQIRYLIDGMISNSILNTILKGATIRSLKAVETLGTITSICINQAAIFTKNQMEVSKVFVDGKILNFEALSTDRSSINNPENLTEELPPDLELLLIISGVFGDFNFDFDSDSDPSLNTDKALSSEHPVSQALLKAISKVGFESEELRVLNKIREFPFDFKRKCASAIFETPTGEMLLFTKGDIESVMEVCRFIQIRGQVDLLTKDQRDAILTVEEVLRSDSSQMMAVAYRKIKRDMENLSLNQLERGLVFVGLISFKDPIDQEAKPSIEKCQNSGIRPILICDSDSKSASSVAEKLGILNDRSRMITRDELEQISEEQYSDEVGRLSTYCGISPGQKLRLINQLQQKGEVVAMTGYRSYDVEPMRTSDLAIASANICADIIIHYSELTLLKNSIQTIIKSIEASRSIYNQLRRSILYFLSNNFSVGGAVLLLFLIHMSYKDFPVAFNLIQILWVNVITVGMLSFILNAESDPTDLAQSKPQRIEDSIFARSFKMHLIMRASLVALAPILIFAISLNIGGWWKSHDLRVLLKASTSASTSLIFGQIILFLKSYRRQNQSSFELLGSNQNLLLWACGIVMFQILSIYTLPLNALFGMAPISFEWLPMLLILGILYITLEFSA